MGGSRPFDDDRHPDDEGFANCFVCARPVDPLSPSRVTYGFVGPLAPELPAHATCLSGRPANEIHALFHRALMEMAGATVH